MGAEHGSADEVARFFDREARSSAACCGDVPVGQLGPISAALLTLVDDLGVSGRTVLDAGCGQGGVTVALGRRGAAAVTGVDLSAESVAVAERAAAQAGVSARFLVADAATVDLDLHDVVVLDKVVCCYPDAAGLLTNTAPAARTALALSMPCSAGPRGVLAKVLLAAENTWRRLRRDGFRAYVHDEAAVSGTLEEHGLHLTRRRTRWAWSLATYERAR